MGINQSGSGKVSIPFKREGSFRPKPAEEVDAPEKRGFNSLQTGRHIQTHHYGAVCKLKPSQVSIPFKREGSFRLVANANTIGVNYMFQFPSNGKAHSDEQYLKTPVGRFVRFNSLQTGRLIQTFAFVFHLLYFSWFQFPSNGKAHSDRSGRAYYRPHDRVSIPFKREGSFRRNRLARR